MIKRNSTVKVILSAFAAFAFWTYICMNMSLYKLEGGSQRFMTGSFVTALVSTLLIFVFGAVKVNMSRRASIITGVFVWIFTVVNSMQIAIVLSDGFYSNVFTYLVNVLIYFVFAGFVLLLTGSMTASAMTAVLVSYVYNMVTVIIYVLRGTALMPTDLYSVGTAMNVAGQYKFTVSYPMITATAMTTAQILLLLKFPLRFTFRFRRLVLRAAGGAVTAAAVLFLTIHDFADYKLELFSQQWSNKIYGSAFSFYLNSTHMGLEKSPSYNPKQLNDKLLSYSMPEKYLEDPQTASLLNTVNDYSQKPAGISADMPNVIVVMNESFTDFSVVNEFETDVDCLSYFNSLKNNTIRGNVLVSTFGGNTCNSEYEFLTGMSVGVLKPQSIPYMQMLFNKMPYSLTTHMRRLGYNTIGFHPYYGNGWNRNKIYNYLGFQKFVSIENLYEYNEEPAYLRGLISDKSNYDAVLNMLYTKEPGTRDFIFNVTMQNHGGYTDENYESSVRLKNMKGSYPLAEQYLSVVKESDSALEHFLENLKMFKEPTIVVMFGDHFPAVEDQFYEELYGKSLNSLDDEEVMRRYQVPFIIWANYDIEEEEDVKTSLCFLSNKLMEAANLPKSRVQMYLDEVQTEVKQINPLGYYDNEGTLRKITESEKLKEYYDLEYALLNNEKLHYDFNISVQPYRNLAGMVFSERFVFGDEYDDIIAAEP